jgi:hypothetical protein
MFHQQSRQVSGVICDTTAPENCIPLQGTPIALRLNNQTAVANCATRKEQSNRNKTKIEVALKKS